MDALGPLIGDGRRRQRLVLCASRASEEQRLARFYMFLERPEAATDGETASIRLLLLLLPLVSFGASVFHISDSQAYWARLLDGSRDTRHVRGGPQRR